MLNENVTFPDRSVTFPLINFYFMNNFLPLLTVKFTGTLILYFLVSSLYEMFLRLTSATQFKFLYQP